MTLEPGDSTWALEYPHSNQLCERGAATDLSSDLWLNRLIRSLGAAAIREAATVQ